MKKIFKWVKRNLIIYNFIKNTYIHIKYSKVLNKAYKDEHIIENLSKMIGHKIKKDWIGRLYVVLNPNIDITGNYNTSQIYEYNNKGMVNKSYVEKWIMDNLNIASKFIQVSNLFDLLTYTLDKLDDYDNYIFIIKPITLDDFIRSLYKFLMLVGVIIIAVSLYIFL